MAVKTLSTIQEITTDTGLVVVGKVIGKGRFSRVYQDIKDDDVIYVLCDEGDDSKEVLSKCSGKHIPPMEPLGYVNYHAGGWYLWQTERSDPLTAKDTVPWKQHIALQPIVDLAHARFSSTYGHLPPTRQESVWAEFWNYFIHFAKDPSIDDDLYESLSSIYTWASSYDNIGIELPKRNLGVRNGVLMLRDVLYTRGLL